MAARTTHGGGRKVAEVAAFMSTTSIAMAGWSRPIATESVDGIHGEGNQRQGFAHGGILYIRLQVFAHVRLPLL